MATTKLGIVATAYSGAKIDHDKKPFHPARNASALQGVCPRRSPSKLERVIARAGRRTDWEGKMLLYEFEAATPWRVALTNDEVGKTLPTEGAPWRLSGSVEGRARQDMDGSAPG